MPKSKSNSDYSDSRGYNLGIAREVGLAEAVVFQQLVFWQGIKGGGEWFYKSYPEMLRELPLSESTIRRCYEKLKDKKYIETKLQKANGVPTLHFRLGQNDRMDPVKMTVSLDPVKMTETINNKTPIKNIHSSDAPLAHHVTAVYELYLKCFKLTGLVNLTVSNEADILAQAKKRYRLTPKRKKAIETRLKDAGFNMLCAAIVGYSREPWYQGENNRDWHADLEAFICRSYEKVEEGANKYESQKANKNTNDPWAS